MSNTSNSRPSPTLPDDGCQDLVIEAISTVAPDVADELRGLSLDADLFLALDLDSMDHLNVMTELATRTGVEVAEREYPRLRTIRSLAERLDSA